MINNPKIWLSSPHMGGGERKYVNEAFDTNWVAPLGPNVTGFENDISSYLTTQNNQSLNTAALTSGTAALHLALVMLGVNANDAVLVQSFTFCGTTNPVVYQGAELVFVDSEKDTWNMDPEALKMAIQALLEDGFGVPQRIEPKNGKGYIRAIMPCICMVCLQNWMNWKRFPRNRVFPLLRMQRRRWDLLLRDRNAVHSV
jgi:dTDP-4-amino-4,6-dideoxygalactose transaminase